VRLHLIALILLAGLGPLLASGRLPAAEPEFGLLKLDNLSAEYGGRQLSNDQLALVAETRWTPWLRPSLGASVSYLDRNFQGDGSLKFGPPIWMTQVYVLGGGTFGSGYFYGHLGCGVDFNVWHVHLSAMLVVSTASNGEAKVSTLIPGFDAGWRF
jgi:hypothetical protein